ncbi:hypothetical protein ElyMa_003592300 [Elysia marginata]|uniref:Uncharacterized protein n=1 Tax=Elysia marginata TaxID=1093978 RepID=A0AAV4EQL9_9GAST|nr:hypothetical protein ElyMa_003592300 [Elysia marginata]
MAVYDENSNVRTHITYGFVITKAMEEQKRVGNLVNKWLTTVPVMQQISFPFKTLLNKLEEFINTNSSALFQHDTCGNPDVEAQNICLFRKAPHFHGVVEP